VGYRCPFHPCTYIALTEDMLSNHHQIYHPQQVQVMHQHDHPATKLGPWIAHTQCPSASQTGGRSAQMHLRSTPDTPTPASRGLRGTSTMDVEMDSESAYPAL
jgi:hypothetical protein